MKKDAFSKKMPVRYSFFRNYLCGIIYNTEDHLFHRIIARDVYGNDHELFNSMRTINKVPKDRHVYHMRYHVKVSEPILFLRLERMRIGQTEWEAVTGIDFSTEYARNTFRPGWYTLFDSFRWDDIFETCD